MNGVGFESGIPQISEEGTAPVLQDVSSQDVWSSWEASWRDVIVLDAENVPSGVQNLTAAPLSSDANYIAMKNLMLGAAGLPLVPAPEPPPTEK